MAGRAIWKGIVQFDGVDIPVRFLSAVEQPRVRFRLLHAEDGVPVEQRWFDPEREETVPKEEVHKAAVLPDGRLVEITKKDLESLEPPASREIEVNCFVPLTAIEPPYFERPYYLAPDGNGDEYAALVKILAEKQLAAIAHWVMRKKHYLGAIFSDGAHLAVSTLRSAAEVVPADALPAPAGPPTKKKEVELARQLIASLEGPFRPEEFSNMYTERVLELVEERAKKHTIRRIGGTPTRKTDESLEALLAKSLKPKQASKPKTKKKTTKKKKVAARRTRGQKPKKRSA